MMERNPLHGCIASILFVSLIMLAVAGGCSFVSYNVANVADVVGETRQVSIHEVQATKRTGIEWDARVEMERIKADVAKKTDFTFLLFWLARPLMWVGIAAMIMSLLMWTYEKARGHEQTVTTPTNG